MPNSSQSTTSTRHGAAFDFDVVTDLRPIPSRPPAPAETGPREKPGEKSSEKAAAEPA